MASHPGNPAGTVRATVSHAKGLYVLFFDETGTLGYRGIINGDTANDVSTSSIPKGEQGLTNLFFNKDGYSAYCREYREYWG